MLYNKIIRPILFLMDAEFVHDLVSSILSVANKSRMINNIIFIFFNFSTPRIKQKLCGLYFRTPIGLAGGMDKKAAAPLLWSAFDFGWAELGSFTAEPWAGNARPRLWRLIKEQGIIVYSGLPNIGALAVSNKLTREIKRYPRRGLWGISIAKTPRVPLEQAAEDYARSFNILEPLANIITINLSCPNVSGFIGLQDPQKLEPILKKITEINKNNKIIFLKIGNDLDTSQLDDIIALVKKYSIHGIIATNLTKKREKISLPSKYADKPGGISGKLISDRANKIIAHLYRQSEGRYIVVGCGGVFTGQDAFTKIKAGAQLIQLATGFIFGGPASIKKINRELDAALKQNDFAHIADAVGREAYNYSL
ncbi:MAG: dihydroorotate dehydrogenase (quinone) [Parcubacteria group bacterium]|nr:MAG: dihydroorotate dehydrogenase (quinone) [Parcubacteria group bacterium]